MNETDSKAESIRSHPNSAAYEDFIREHNSFIVATAAAKLGRYIQVENDGAYAVALQAFAEALENYDSAKGHFLSFARLVIERRLLNWQQTQRQQPVVSLDGLEVKDGAPTPESQLLMRDEIRRFEDELDLYGITLETLADRSPKHRDTRSSTQDIARRFVGHPDLLGHLRRRRRLPYAKTALRLGVSRKVLTGNSDYIISLVIILTGDFDLLRNWL